MKKVMTLRAGAEFKRTLLHGQRIEGQLLRCHYLVHEEGGLPVQVGFVVPSSRYNAVRRNRIKRLLREAFAVEGTPLHDALTHKRERVSLVFYFKGDTRHEVRKLKLHAVQEQVTALCRAVIVQLGLKGQCQQP